MSPEPTADVGGALDPDTIEQLGTLLFDAEHAARQVQPLTTSNPDVTVADAYAIQQVYARHRRAGGATLVGHKIGCMVEGTTIVDVLEGGAGVDEGRDGCRIDAESARCDVQLGGATLGDGGRALSRGSFQRWDCQSSAS